MARTLISDRLATALNDLQGELEVSDLFNDEQSRRRVLQLAFPKTLVDKVGLDELLKRLPESVCEFYPFLKDILLTSSINSTFEHFGVYTLPPSSSSKRAWAPLRSISSCSSDRWNQISSRRKEKITDNHNITRFLGTSA